MKPETEKNIQENGEPVSKQELNSWKRGFTPQAEIWNGRMATIGLLLVVLSLVLTNIFLAN